MPFPITTVIKSIGLAKNTRRNETADKIRGRFALERIQIFSNFRQTKMWQNFRTFQILAVIASN